MALTCLCVAHPLVSCVSSIFVHFRMRKDEEGKRKAFCNSLTALTGTGTFTERWNFCLFSLFLAQSHFGVHILLVFSKKKTLPFLGWCKLNTHRLTNKSLSYFFPFFFFFFETINIMKSKSIIIIHAFFCKETCLLSPKGTLWIYETLPELEWIYNRLKNFYNKNCSFSLFLRLSHS